MIPFSVLYKTKAIGSCWLTFYLHTFVNPEIPSKQWKMIPKTLLLAFLSLQGTREPQTPERSSPLSKITHLDVVNELTATLQDARAGIDEAISEIEFSTGPSVHKSADDQVSFAIPFEEEMVAGHEVKEIIVSFHTIRPWSTREWIRVHRLTSTFFFCLFKFTSTKPPETYPDGFRFNEKSQKFYSLHDAFKDLPPPPTPRGVAPHDIKYGWGLGGKSGGHRQVHFSFGVPVQDVRVQFGWIEDDKLKAGNWNLWALDTQGPFPEEHSGDFPASKWAETRSIIKPAKSFLLEVSPPIVDGILVITRILYRLE